MFGFHGRDGLGAVRLIISGPAKRGENGTARRPSLPKMNEFLVGCVAEARAGLLSTLVHNDLEGCGPSQPQFAHINTVSRRQGPPDMRLRQVTRRRPTALLMRPFLRHRLRSVEWMDLGSRNISFP
jgi:hypothetical protein